MVRTTSRTISTKGQGDAVDVTAAVQEVIGDSRLREGLATIAVIGSTAGVTTIEFEPGAIADLNAVFEALAPRHGEYEHHLRWGDDNGSSHVRAALLGPSISLPFANGRLLVGTWQQVMLLELDTRARERELVVQLIGE